MSSISREKRNNSLDALRASLSSLGTEKYSWHCGMAYDQDELSRINSSQEVDRVLNVLMKKQWVVFSKPTRQRTETVLGYLAQYTYRIAMSDRRLLSMD